MFVLATARTADAGVHAGLYVPPPPAVPAGPVAAALTNAYRATIGAAPGPSALAANVAYLRAVQAASRGDRSGALAAAAEAQARALSVAPLPAAVALPSSGEAFAAPPTQGIPIVSAGLGAAGDPDLGRASNQIAIAEQSAGGRIALDRAKAHYRAALDAYVDGNAAKTKREADAAFDLATDAIARR
ncbi:MAG: hypothetical protein IAI48_10865 [Candidatus Eremiobacteraeota bacterium]|nr:hypothetical protein [Candidatus Eremiobacteraeota bacterium]